MGIGLSELKCPTFCLRHFLWVLANSMHKNVHCRVHEHLQVIGLQREESRRVALCSGPEEVGHASRYVMCTWLKLAFLQDFLSPISNPERESRQVKPWLAWNADFWLIMNNNKASELASLAGVERGWKVSLSRLTEFFPNSILRETQRCATDTCHILLVGARDILVTFDDACPTSSVWSPRSKGWPR